MQHQRIYYFVVDLDNCSNLNVIRDRELAIYPRLEKVGTRISGSIPGTLTSKTSAGIGDFGRGCYDPKFSRNLISEVAAIKAGYRVVRDSGLNNHYSLIKEGRPQVIFKANAEGTFSITTSECISHFRDMYATSNSTDVRRETLVFKKAKRKGC